MLERVTGGQALDDQVQEVALVPGPDVHGQAADHRVIHLCVGGGLGHQPRAVLATDPEEHRALQTARGEGVGHRLDGPRVPAGVEVVENVGAHDLFGRVPGHRPERASRPGDDPARVDDEDDHRRSGDDPQHQVVRHRPPAPGCPPRPGDRRRWGEATP